MRYLLILTGLLAAAIVVAEEIDSSLYTLDHPGLEFGLLPPEMNPPVEGSLGPEAGEIAGFPNEKGVEFHVRYEALEIDESFRKGDWLEEKLQSCIIIPADGGIMLGDQDWVEGSTGTAYRDQRSIGLVPVINFNLTSEEQGIYAGGRAAAIFRNGYATIIYTIAPWEHISYARQAVDALLAAMFLAP